MRRRLDTVVDVIALVVIIATVLSLLDDRFASRAYLVAGLVPVAALIGLALFVIRFGLASWWYWLVGILCYAPMGALVALHRPGPYLLPSYEAMMTVLGETATAPGTLVSTLPPVDTTGSVMLVPFAVGYISCLLAAWPALATRAPLLPVVPPLFGLAVAIAVGVFEPSFLVARAVVLGIVLTVWPTARARRTQVLVGRRRGSVPTMLAAILTIAAVSGVVTLLTPDDVDEDRVVYRPRMEGEVVETAGENLPLFESRERDPLLRARGVPEDVRLRFVTLDEYDGEVWRPAEESPGAGARGVLARIGTEVSTEHEGQLARVQVSIRPGYTGSWLPLLGELSRLQLDSTDGRSQLRDVRYNPASQNALVLGGVDPRERYTFSAVLTPQDVDRSEPVREATEGQRQPGGAFLDRYLKPFAQAPIDPLDRVLMLADYLNQQGAVRLQGTSSQDPVDLGLRLLGSEDFAATPFQYSAVMALGASRLGVPARVVVGAEPRRSGLVRQEDVESWVELQFDDGTWRVLDADRYTGTRAVITSPEEEREPADASSWVRQELDKSAESDDDDAAAPDGSAEPDPRDIPLSRIVGSLLGALVAGALVLWLLVPLMKAVRRRRRRSRERWTAPYVEGWQEILDQARDLGRPVPDRWGRLAQAQALGIDESLARRADEAVFAPVATTPEDAAAYWDDAQRCRESLGAELPRWRRLRALFNPASLLAAWARRRHDVAASRTLGPDVRHEDRGAGGEQAARA